MAEPPECSEGVCTVPIPDNTNNADAEQGADNDTSEEEIPNNTPTECTGGVCTAPVPGKPDGTDGEEDAQKPNDEKPSNKTVKKKAGSLNPNILKIHAKHEMDQLIASRDFVVVEFVTSWCGACHGIEPLFEELVNRSDEGIVACAQVVCDKNKETKKLAAARGVKSYPVFEVFENGNATQKWNGADRGKLEKVFDRFGGDRKGNRKSKGGKRKGKR